jgi:phosphoglucomutase
MTISPLAGKLAPKDIVVDLARLEQEYYARWPDMADPTQRVSFGTSGHRGSPLHGAFTEAHILAITQAICDYRRRQGTDGPLYLGKDTHALSGPAQRTALEVLAANRDESGVNAPGSEAQQIVDNALADSWPGLGMNGRRIRWHGIWPWS